MKPDVLHFDCPVCGQGGLCRVKLRQYQNREVTLCRECERMWWDNEVPQGLANTVDFISFMEERGLSPYWDDIEILRYGIYVDETAKRAW